MTRIATTVEKRATFQRTAVSLGKTAEVVVVTAVVEVVMEAVAVVTAAAAVDVENVLVVARQVTKNVIAPKTAVVVEVDTAVPRGATTVTRRATYPATALTRGEAAAVAAVVHATLAATRDITPESAHGMRDVAAAIGNVTDVARQATNSVTAPWKTRVQS